MIFTSRLSSTDLLNRDTGNDIIKNGWGIILKLKTMGGRRIQEYQPHKKSLP
jgi:hypothetical protein